MSESPVEITESTTTDTTVPNEEAKAEETPSKPLVNLTEWYTTQQAPIQKVLQKEAAKDATDDHFESMVAMMLTGKNYDKSSLPIFRLFVSSLAVVSAEPEPISPKSNGKKKGKSKATKSASAAAKAAKSKSSQKAKVKKSANAAAFEATAQRQRKESVTMAAKAAAKAAVSGKMKSSKAPKRAKLDPKKLVNSELRAKGKQKPKPKAKTRPSRSRTRGDLEIGGKGKHHRIGSAQASSRSSRSPRAKSPRAATRKSNLNVRKAARPKSRTVGVDEAPDISKLSRSNSSKSKSGLTRTNSSKSKSKSKKHQKRLSGITISDETGTIQSTKKWRPIDYDLQDDGRSFLDEKQAERGDNMDKEAEFRKDARREWPEQATLSRSRSARDEFGIKKRKTSPNPISTDMKSRMSIALANIPASPVTPNTPDFDDDALLTARNKFARNMRRAKSTGDVGITLDLDSNGNLRRTSEGPGKLNMNDWQHLKHISVGLSNNNRLALKEDDAHKFTKRKSASDENVHS